MINRNQFLSDFDSKHKVFIDDDDFTCGLEYYYKIYQLYVSNINKIYLTIRDKIIETLHYFEFEFDSSEEDFIRPGRLALHTSGNKFEISNVIHELYRTFDILEFRKLMRDYLLPDANYNIVKRLIYSIYTKMNMYNFPVMRINPIINEIERSIDTYADWSKIIPPYMPINFIMVNDTLCEDVMFSKINYTQTNYFDVSKPIYYYLFEAHSNHWGTWENCSWFERIHILSYLNLIKPNYFKYTFVNIGRYYYKYDSVVEFEIFENEDDSKNKNSYKLNPSDLGRSCLLKSKILWEQQLLNPSELGQPYLLRFVTGRANRKITIDDILKKYENIDKWNDKLSEEYLKILY